MVSPLIIKDYYLLDVPKSFVILATKFTYDPETPGLPLFSGAPIHKNQKFVAWINKGAAQLQGSNLPINLPSR